jgi:hypothetical protein
MGMWCDPISVIFGNRKKQAMQSEVKTRALFGTWEGWLALREGIGSGPWFLVRCFLSQHPRELCTILYFNQKVDWKSPVDTLSGVP